MSFIGELVRRVRSALGWTQRRLAEELGLTVDSIQNYERGRRRPDASVVWNLSTIAPEPLRADLRKMLPPSFLRGVTKFREESNVAAIAAGIEAKTWTRLRTLAEKKKVDAGMLLSEAIDIGLRVLAATPSSTRQAHHLDEIIERLQKATEEVHVQSERRKHRASPTKRKGSAA